MSIHIRKFEVDMPLGSFFGVEAIAVTEHHISILSDNKIEYLIAFSGSPETTGTFGTFETAEGIHYLDHLDLEDVTRIEVTDEHLRVTVDPGVTYVWRVYRSEGGCDV